MMGLSPAPRLLAVFIVVLVTAIAGVRVRTGTLSGQLQVARSGHQATLLLDGRVLVTGGSDESGRAIGLGEIYDPRSRTWSAVAANLAPRVGHAATRLHDGRVLVVGGAPATSGCETISSAEVYEPSSDRWSLTAQIPVPVGRGTIAVTLDDGRVLIGGGGTGCGDVHGSTALFDPHTSAWSRTAPMNVPAQFHVAARLADGRVLVSGSSTMLYDPSTALWAALGDPRPLIEIPCEGDADRYRQALRRDALVARATSDGCASVTVLPGGTLLVAGGVSASGHPIDSVRLLDLRTGGEHRSWPMQAARAGHTATRLKNGAVLIAGGQDGEASISSSEIYIPRLSYEATIRATPRGAYARVVGYSADYGEWLATATTSRGHLLIAYRGGTGDGTNLLEWDLGRWRGHPSTWPKPRYPPYLRALAPDAPSLDSIRIDEHDNIWGVSSDSQEILKLSADGEVLLRFGKPSYNDTPAAPRRRRAVQRPSDVAVDPYGNVFVVDAGARPDIVKFDGRGRFLAAASAKGSNRGELDRPRSIATDAKGNVYVADSGRARIHVFDNGLSPVASYDHVGTPWAVCITRGSPQFLYSASNPDKARRARRIAEIYKLELDGTILGKAVGDEGNPYIHSLDHIHCRQTDTIVGLGVHNLHEFRFSQ